MIGIIISSLFEDQRERERERERESIDFVHDKKIKR